MTNLFPPNTKIKDYGYPESHPFHLGNYPLRSNSSNSSLCLSSSSSEEEEEEEELENQLQIIIHIIITRIIIIITIIAMNYITMENIMISQMN